MSLDLLKLQRDLAAAVTGRPPEDADPYVHAVAGSLAMKVTRRIIASWRELLVRRLCPLTVTLLNRRSRLRAEMDTLAEMSSTAWVDDIALEFLRRLTGDPAAIVAATAKFEQAAIMAGRGIVDRASVTWPCDPEELIRRLASGAPLEGIAAGQFETVISTVD